MKDSNNKRIKSDFRQALFIALLYLCLGILWIIASDRVLMLFFDETVLLSRFQTIKGVSYVAVTALLLFFLIRRAFKNLVDLGRELEKQKEQHRRTARHIEAIIEAAPLAIFDLHPDGRVKSLWNSAAEQMFGWSREEVLGRQLPIMPPENEEEYKSMWEKVLAGEYFAGKELTGLTKLGNPVHFSIAAAPVCDDRGTTVERITAVAEDIAERKEREKTLQNIIYEKEILLKEIHHRVKNNLQIISSLINLQMGKTESVRDKDLFQSTRNRIRALALVHEKLYKSRDMSKVDFAGYIKDIVKELFETYRKKQNTIELRLDLEQITIDITKATPLGFMCNELFVNSLCHAFPNDNRGVLAIQLKRTSQGCSLLIKDDGIGLPGDIDVENPKSFGLTMVQSLAKQIDAEVRFTSDRGTEIDITCPV